MNAIEIRNLTKSFLSLYALDGLNMTVPVGGMTGIPDGNGGFHFLNLLEDENAQRIWRATVSKVINDATSAYEIYMMVTKPYALTFLKFASHHRSRGDLSEILASAWTRSEAPNQDELSVFVKLFVAPKVNKTEE